MSLYTRRSLNGEYDQEGTVTHYSYDQWLRLWDKQSPPEASTGVAVLSSHSPEGPARASSTLKSTEEKQQPAGNNSLDSLPSRCKMPILRGSPGKGPQAETVGAQAPCQAENSKTFRNNPAWWHLPGVTRGIYVPLLIGAVCG